MNYRDIIKKLCENGYEAFLAGGSVRDMLLGVPHSDHDIVTNARPGEIVELFGKNRVTVAGKTFMVCIVGRTEVATYRKSYGHSEESLGDIYADTLREDLGKRDLTVNSMALCVDTGDVVDPFGGRRDLAGGIIRFTGDPRERIEEDPLRMVRACRFLALLGGSFHRESFLAVCEKASLLASRVAPERIRHEVLKAMGTSSPELFFKALHDTGCLKYIFPSLERTWGLSGGPNHGETVFEHSMIVGKTLKASDPVFRLAGFLHDVGKAETAKVRDGKLTFHGHEGAIGHLMKELLDLRFSVSEREKIENTILVHMHALNETTSPKAVRRLLAVLGERGISWRDFLRIRIADKKANLAKPDFTADEIRFRVELFRRELEGGKAAAFSIGDLNITGGDIMGLLNLSSGPEIGEILRYLLGKVIDDPTLNKRETLFHEVESYWKGVLERK